MKLSPLRASTRALSAIIFVCCLTTFFAAANPRQAHAQAGSVDTTGFQPLTFGPSYSNYVVRSAAVTSDGGIVIGGAFTQINGTTQGHYAKLMHNGTLSTFNQGVAGADSNVFHLTLDQNDGVLLGGVFTQIDGVARNYLGRLGSAGQLDPYFDATGGGVTNAAGTAPPYYPGVEWVQIEPSDGKVLIGGQFDTVQGYPRHGLARLTSGGTIDPTFDPGAGVSSVTQPNATPQVYALAVQSDNSVLIGAGFDLVNGESHVYVARYGPTGALDRTFNPNIAESAGTSGVYAIIVQPADGNILIAGDFTTINGVSRPGIARLLPSGDLDPSFNPGAGVMLSASTTHIGQIFAMALQPDGRIVIGGQFDQYNGVARKNVARLNRDGSLDTNFDPGVGANSPIECLALQSDGNIIIGGYFTAVGGYSYPLVARLLGGASALQFNTATADVAEAAGSVTLIVNRTGSSSGAVSVKYATVDGSAVAGRDYTPASGVLTWADGDAGAKTIVVPVIDRHLYSGSTNFYVNLSQPSGNAELGAPLQGAVTIHDNDTPPQTIQEVDLLSPPTNISTVLGQQLTLYSSVTATVNTLHGEFFVLDANAQNPQSLGTFDNVSRSQSTWTPPAAGKFYLRVVVTDTAGGSSGTVTIPITIIDPAAAGASPQTNLYGGLDGRTLALGDSVQVIAQAVDADGNPLQNAQFYLDGAPISSSPVSQGNVAALKGNQPAATSGGGALYKAQVSVAKNQQLLTAVGVNSKGVSAVSNAFTIYAKNNPGTPPSVAIGNVANGASLPAGSTGQSVSVTASAGSQTLSTVEMYVDNQRVGVATSAPYTFNLPSLTTGTHVLSAVATDISKLSRASAPVVVQATTTSSHPAFFTGEVALGQGVYYLAFPGNGNIFGYYEYLSDPRYVYHFDLGFEYVFDLGNGGVVFYDFASQDYFYTGSSFSFPYLYDFGLQAFLYYYPDPTNPQRYNTNGVRYFYNFSTGKVISK